MFCPQLFFYNNPATTEIYALSLHDALPISARAFGKHVWQAIHRKLDMVNAAHVLGDRKSTRLNSSHGSISYAVFCLKKKKRTGCASPCTTVGWILVTPSSTKTDIPTPESRS